MSVIPYGETGVAPAFLNVPGLEMIYLSFQVPFFTHLGKTVTTFVKEKVFKIYSMFLKTSCRV